MCGKKKRKGWLGRVRTHRRRRDGTDRPTDRAYRPRAKSTPIESPCRRRRLREDSGVHTHTHTQVKANSKHRQGKHRQKTQKGKSFIEASSHSNNVHKKIDKRVEGFDSSNKEVERNADTEMLYHGVASGGGERRGGGYHTHLLLLLLLMPPLGYSPVDN